MITLTVSLARIAPLRAEEVEDNILCLNHSFEPNVGVRGQITFVTLRYVDRGEEFTIDYAMIDGDPEGANEVRLRARRVQRADYGR